MIVAAMNHARKEGLLDIVPHVEKPEEGPPRDKWARPHEVKQLTMVLSKYPHLELFALLALHTLSRKRAVCELKWEQVDFDLGQIDFNPPNRQRTRKRRVPVPINKTLMEALKNAREVATTEHVIEFRGNPCYEIGRAFRKYARQANLGWLTPHVLRHTGATLMAQNGVSMVEVAGIMGDRIDTVEKHYLKYHPDYLKNATAALDKIYA
jgi:integrase